jgi:SAM-dependent methyltransferase
VLDAGCGAGWVGIEAALAGAMASAFDPSPAMVEIAKRNAESCGVDLDARVGFVEDVPFERPFDVVLNSGVISFAPDADVFLRRLDALVESGGLLVIGDLNPLSRGFRRRRRRPLLPARELNGLPRPLVESLLGDLGYTVEGRWYYQITFPLPEFMALSEQRMKGFGCGLSLLLNRSATAVDHAAGSRLRQQFDSWIVRARKPGRKETR